MVLVLAVHHLPEAASAKVPFSMVVLLDCVSKKLHPPEFKCRQILPTNGAISASLWESSSIEALSAWLQELLEGDCSSEVFEVQEQFAVGLFSDLTAARAADQVSGTARSLAAASSQQFDKFDERFRVSEQAGTVLKNVREFGGKVGTQTVAFTKTVSSRAMENDKVAQTAQATAQAFRGLGDRFATSFRGLGFNLGPSAAAGTQSQQATGLQANIASPASQPMQSPAAAATKGPVAANAQAAQASEPVKAPQPAPQEQPAAQPAAASPAHTNDFFSLGEEVDEDAVAIPTASEVVPQPTNTAQSGQTSLTDPAKK